jgi:hypothetical protein
MKFSKCILLCVLFCSCCFPSVAQQSGAPSMGIMDLKKIEATDEISGLRDDLVWFRLNPSVLEDPTAMRYFIALNNCDSRTLMKQMDSEFDYPNMVAFYKSKAPEILSQVPLWLGYSASVHLGEYDMTKKAFPLTDSNGKKITITLNSFTMSADRGPLNYTCGNALAAINRPDSVLDYSLTVTVPTATYSALAMDEDAARRYVEGRGAGRAGGGRSITVLLEFDIPQQTPGFTPRGSGGAPAHVQLQGKISKITVLGGYPAVEMGTLVQ